MNVNSCCQNSNEPHMPHVLSLLTQSAAHLTAGSCRCHITGKNPMTRQKAYIGKL